MSLQYLHTTTFTFSCIAKEDDQPVELLNLIELLLPKGVEREIRRSDEVKARDPGEG